MKFSLSAVAILAAVTTADASVLVKRPAPIIVVSSSSPSSSASPSPAKGGCRPRAIGLYGCLLSSTYDALEYCSTEVGVYPTASTTQVVEIGPTHYVSVAADVVSVTSTDLSVATLTSTTGTETSFVATSTATATSTQTWIEYEYEKRGVQDRDLGKRMALVDREVVTDFEEDPSAITAHVVKRVTVTSTATTDTCTTSSTVTVTTYKKRHAPTPVGANANVAARKVEPESIGQYCSGIYTPASSALSSVCSELVAAYGVTPDPVTVQLLVPGPTITVSSGVSSATAVVESTSTKTVLTVLQVTAVSTTTVSTCSVFVKTITVTGA